MLAFEKYVLKSDPYEAWLLDCCDNVEIDATFNRSIWRLQHKRMQDMLGAGLVLEAVLQEQWSQELDARAGFGKGFGVVWVWGIGLGVCSSAA